MILDICPCPAPPCFRMTRGRGAQTARHLGLLWGSLGLASVRGCPNGLTGLGTSIASGRAAPLALDTREFSMPESDSVSAPGTGRAQQEPAPGTPSPGSSALPNLDSSGTHQGAWPHHVAPLFSS